MMQQNNIPNSESSPANPEMENVSANLPENEAKPEQKKNVPAALPPTAMPGAKPLKPAPPRKMAKDVSKQKSNTKFLLGCAGGLLLLFILFVALMVFVMSRGGGDNAVIQAFGLAPAAIKSFLLTIINSGFGFLGILFFVLMVIGVFRRIGAKRDDSEAKRKGLRMFVLGLIPFVFVLVVWAFLFNFIRNLEITAEKVVAEIVVTAPENLENLQAPLEITFSALRVKQALAASKLGVTSANWDLDGDGFFETPVAATGEITRLYQNRGIFNVGLQVQVVGETAPREYKYPLEIKEAVFVAEPATGTAPLRVAFDARHLIPTGNKLESLDWDFNEDGRYELTGDDNEEPFYVFDKIGKYKVHLRVVDKNNNVENYYREIEVKPSDVPIVSARINAGPELLGPIPLSINFDGSDSESLKGKITRYEWDFGDNSEAQEGKKVSHVYQTPGSFRAVLNVTDDSGVSAETSADITAEAISSVPVAKIKSLPAASGETVLGGTLPFRISFDASASSDPDGDIVDYQWDFNGDGTTDTSGKKVNYTFEKSGDFTVSLTVQDSLEHTSSDTLTVKILEPGAQAQIQADPIEGTAPLIVHFDGSGSSAFRGTIASYEWDFGDGSPKSITGATIDHRYSAVGSYAVKLKVTTSQGESAENTITVFAREVPLKSCFEASRITGTAPLTVTFDSKCSTGSIAGFHWDFGDGDESTSRKPSHTFNTPGNYTVILEVSDSKNNVNTFSQGVVVQALPIQ